MEKVYYGQYVMSKEDLKRIEKKIDDLNKKLDDHIKRIWEVYEPIKKILKVFTR